MTTGELDLAQIGAIVQTTALLSLRASVEAASHAGAKGEAVAMLGAYLAQLGEFAEANEIQSYLKASFSAGDYPRVSIRLMILEALIAYYSSKSEFSLDRIRRAKAVASAFGYEDLLGEVAVWTVHLAFNFERYGEFGEAIDLSFNRLDELRDHLRARICLSVADAHQYLGELSLSSDWYKFARIFSRRAHDRALIAAIEYNRLSMGLARYRVCRAMRQPIDAVQRNWYLELTSVQALAESFGGKALPELIDMCGLLTCQLNGDYEGAIHSLDRIMAAGATNVCGMSEDLARLERLWCSIGQPVAPSEEVRQFTNLDVIDRMSLNDQLIALPYIHDICDRYDIALDSVRFDDALERASRYFAVTTSDMRVGVARSEVFLETTRQVALEAR